MLEKEPLFPIKNNFAKYRDTKSILEWGNPDAINKPQVSVIVPVCNHPEYLEETLSSILNQNYEEEYEVIVVDNNMTQPHSPNLEIIRKVNNRRILYYRHENDIKFAANCNRGIELARGKYVSFCHDDDLFLPNTLSCLMQIQKEVGNKCIIASYNVIDAQSNLIYKAEYPHKSKWGFMTKHYHDESLYWLIVRCAWLVIGSLWNRDCLIKSGGFSQNQAPCEDYALQAIYTSLYGCVFCHEPTFSYRKANNASRELYHLFPERDIHIMSDIIPKIKYVPDWWLQTMINFSFKNVANSCAITWGGANDIKSYKYTFAEKIIGAVNKFIYRRKATKL